jgi:restriction endonuclease S subunit
VGQLNVIRPAAGLDAGYLLWFLNLPTTGAKLKQMLTGTSIKALTKTALQTLEVDLPDMERQRCIAEIVQLAGRIAAIRHRLTELDALEVAQIAGLFPHRGGDHA